MVVDKHVSRRKEFEWVSKICILCRDIYTKFMWGLDYEKLMKTSEHLRIKFHSLENFSDTRFANSKSRVFDKVIKMLPAILSVLESDVLRAEENRSGCEAAITAIREKGDKSREIRGCLYNKLNLLLLMAGLMW